MMTSHLKPLTNLDTASLTALTDTASLTPSQDRSISILYRYMHARGLRTQRHDTVTSTMIMIIYNNNNNNNNNNSNNENTNKI